jgi:hypothetical protein
MIVTNGKNLRFWVTLILATFAHLHAFGQYQQSGDRMYYGVTGFSYILKTPYIGAGTAPANLKVIEIDSGLFGNNEKVQVYDGYNQNGSVSGKVQEWLFIPSGRIDGQMSYYIINRWHGTYIEASAVNGQVKAKPFNGALNQKWFIDAGLNFNQVFLRAASSGLYLTFPNSGNGSTVTMQNLTLAPAQQITLTTYSTGVNLPAYNWNYSQPRLIRLADNTNLVLGDSGQSSANVQNQVVVLQNRVAGANYQVWEPYTENTPSYISNLPGDDGFRLFKRWTNFTIAPWNNNGAQGFGITTRDYEPNPGQHQRWYAVPSRVDGQYILVHAASGLTIMPQFNGQGALLVFVPISAASSQRWVFTSI